VKKSASFRPLQRLDGYLPIEDHGLIGDGATAALVGRDGSIPWLCVPRFDSTPLFCGILDRGRGGGFTVAPENAIESRQFYDGDTGVLVTEIRSARGLVRITDALLLRPGASLAPGVNAAAGALLRSLRVIEGQVRVDVSVEPRGGAGLEARRDHRRLMWAARPDLDLRFASNPVLGGLRGALELGAGESARLLLSWGKEADSVEVSDAEEALQATAQAWRAWNCCFSYDGPQAALVRRSAITLKMLDHFENGAMVAAPTSSLPEWIGGERNWDYRYAWVRDAAFSVYALRRVGLRGEAEGFLRWVLDVCRRDGAPRVMYDLDGQAPAAEWRDGELEGYRRSAPVRWGNAAANQRQNDAYGEILDCAHQWAAGGATIDADLWAHLRPIVEAARRDWRTPDHGIWEVRTAERPFTYSVALCQVALDRGARLAERFGLPGDAAGWRAEAERIRRALLEEAWDERHGGISQHLGGGDLDASVLALPLRRVIPSDHPRMVATTEAVVRRLGAGNGLLYRYLPHAAPDGLAGHEGAFLLCSFWLVDNLAYQGRLEEAMELYDSLCARANHVGLLPEEIDPSTGQFLGNFPQAFSHVGLIASGYVLGLLSP
jgi:GH15 family glucan-1,4-alpha-glucosidase